ncbi:hypothetical protein BJY04DRAFT_216161 [Aspergillus karnatakaensis]|uniref:uncharacterized protein n=1 Tax=Aspergillus karnatakaensis TaxID=1810916 RepID=UPI003CCCA2AE
MNVPSDEHPSKRLKVRKGTHSCRECRRRKVKCTFLSSDDITCIICRRRGTQCIGQDLIENAPYPRLTPVDESSGVFSPSPASTLQSHTVTNQYLQDRRTDGRVESTATLPLTPASDKSSIRRQTPYSNITQALLRALPHKKDLNILQTRISRISSFCYQSNFKSRLGTRDKLPKAAIPVPSLLYPESHPVLLARQMLLFAAGLQHLPSNTVIPGLTEHHHHIMERLAESAIKEVTTNDALLGSLEGLENIVLETFYHVDSGNIRRSWITLRRGVMAAQLLGLHQPGHYRFKCITETNELDPEIMWACIVSMERVVSILLGLPTSYIPATQPSTVTPQLQSSITLAPSSALGLINTNLAAKITERNQITTMPEFRSASAAIDRTLISEIAHIPSSFWRPLSFAGLEVDSAEAFWEAGRAWDHMCYYTMVNQLHLPFILCPTQSSFSLYSRMACVNASREILNRQIAIRTFNPITACSRMGDFLALVAGMTLTLAHLVSHSYKGVDQILIHQRLSDRATVEQALECMKSMEELQEDVLASRCRLLLRDLLEIEATAAGAAAGQKDQNPSELIIKVPYIGTVRIAPEGVEILPAGPREIESEAQSGTLPSEGVTIGGIGSIHVKTTSSPTTPRDMHPGETAGNGVLLVQAQSAASGLAAGGSQYDPMLFPDAAASMDDWVLQGFDTAFFDALMRGGADGQLGAAGTGPTAPSEVEGWDLGSLS